MFFKYHAFGDKAIKNLFETNEIRGFTDAEACEFVLLALSRVIDC